MRWLPGLCLIPYLVWGLLRGAEGKWVEGRVDTKDNWAFLARFCFLSVEGQFEYLIEFDKDMGVPNLLLYYDDDNQWPAVYHSSKSCKERESVLNKAGQNQILKLSYWYPETEYSGCIITQENKELPALKSTTFSPPTTTSNPYTTKTTKPRNQSRNEHPLNPSYYDQFLKTSTNAPKTTISDNSSTWYEVFPTDDLNLTTTGIPEDELWESISPEKNESQFENLSDNDVELMFDNNSNRTHKIKRSTFALYEHYRRRSLNSDSNQNGHGNNKRNSNTERLVVSCHHSRRFRSARERWWFIAISNCGSNKGLDVRYKFLMTNGPDGDFWREHFSADEFYVLPVLLAYMFAYVIVMVAVVMCSVELKSRHLLHSTYKLFLVSIVVQHSGVVLQCLAYIRYAANGIGSENTKIIGQFLCGVSETTFLLLLILMAKGYTITRGRLKVGFTVKLTVFMCCYIVTYIVLFIYQAKAFDPGEVLYLYESPAGYGLIILRVTAWCVFAYSTYNTVKKYPEKNMFYGPFFICGTLWFHAGPLFVLVANSYIDKWVRESVVTAVLLFIAFSGHVMFLLLTLPVFANKNFPYHVRTTQIGIMAVDSAQSYGPAAYHPASGAPQTVIIPLTRRTEELIGNMYSQYMATAPPLSLGNDTPKLNGISKRTNANPSRTLIQQDSTDTNTSEDIKPCLPKADTEIFTVENQMAKIEGETSKNSITNIEKPNTMRSFPDSDSSLQTESLPHESMEAVRNDLPSILRPKRNILEPIRREEVPSWSLAKGPCVVAMQKKNGNEDASPPANSSLPPINGHIIKGNLPVTNGALQLPNGKKVPPVKNGLQSNSGEISTIMEGHVQSYKNSVSKATIDLFSVSSNKG